MKKHFLLIYIFFWCFCPNSPAQEMELKDCFLQHKLQPTYRIIEDRYGFIWWMREDGFYRYDGKNIDFIDPSFDARDASFFPTGNILALENGDYWFSARGMGVFQYQADQDTFHHIISNKPPDDKSYIYGRHVTYVPNHGIFIASSQGVWQLDINRNFINSIKPSDFIDKNKVKVSRLNEVRKTLYDEKRQVLWIVGGAGLISYDLVSKELNRHVSSFYNKRRPNDSGSFLINDILIKDNQLLLSTWGGGVHLYSPETREWEQYFFEDEIKKELKSGNTQFGKTRGGRFFFAHEVREAASWLPGNNYFDIPKYENKKIGRGIGSIVDRLGYLWVGHWQEVCRYIVKDEPPIQKNSKIYLNSIFIDSIKQYQRMHRWDHQNLGLNQKPNSIKFIFRVINPLTFNNIQYEYRLEGKSDQWVKNGNSEEAIFEKLSYGEYKFQARYFDEITQQYIYTGKVTIKIERLNLVNRNFVIGLLGLIGIGFLAFLYYRKLEEKRRKLEEEKYKTQLREVQDAALRSQMNPHFLFNSLNSIRYFIVTNDNDKAAGYLTKFSRLIRLILENSKKKLVLLEDEIQLLDLYVKMEQIRFENKFDYEVIIDKNVNPSKVQLPPMLIQPYIENAIIHGINPKDGKGKILLSFKIKNPYLLIEINDDGIGRERSKQLKRESVFKKKSLGLSITKARLDLSDTKENKSEIQINDLKDEQNKPIGTQVIIRLPLI